MLECVSAGKASCTMTLFLKERYMEVLTCLLEAVHLKCLEIWVAKRLDASE
jgi:hypothetical protein